MGFNSSFKGLITHRKINKERKLFQENKDCAKRETQ